jgi:hypothetical protein
MNSKYSYVAAGFNVGIAIMGAMIKSVPLVAIGAFFALVNWYLGEKNRALEDKILRWDTEVEQLKKDLDK